MLDRQWFVLYVVVCLEVGLFLSLVPWSTVWERNFFLQAYPSLRPVLLAPAMRGAVAGLGLANIYVAVSEVWNRRRPLPSTTTANPPRGDEADGTSRTSARGEDSSGEREAATAEERS
jgi:hypothetical protein